MERGPAACLGYRCIRRCQPRRTAPAFRIFGNVKKRDASRKKQNENSLLAWHPISGGFGRFSVFQLRCPTFGAVSECVATEP